MFPTIIDSDEGRLLWCKAVDSNGKATGTTLIPVAKINCYNGDDQGTLIYTDNSDEPIGVPHPQGELIKVLSKPAMALSIKEGE